MSNIQDNNHKPAHEVSSDAQSMSEMKTETSGSPSLDDNAIFNPGEPMARWIEAQERAIIKNENPNGLYSWYKQRLLFETSQRLANAIRLAGDIGVSVFDEKYGGFRVSGESAKSLVELTAAQIQVLKELGEATKACHALPH